MRLEVDTSVWPDFFMSAAWYELERRGLGAELMEEAAATLGRIELHLSVSRASIDPFVEHNCPGFPLACFMKLSAMSLSSTLSCIWDAMKRPG
jgi:hypothetical protein